jgi:hypothetical protein
MEDMLVPDTLASIVNDWASEMFRWQKVAFAGTGFCRKFAPGRRFSDRPLLIADS